MSVEQNNWERYWLSEIGTREVKGGARRNYSNSGDWRIFEEGA
jgi:hypothetical protein